MKALLEAVAFEMKLNLEILEQSGCQVTELIVIGGGAKSEVWSQLKADVIGKPITILDVTEAGCKGAAMLTKAAHVQESIVDIVKEWEKPLMRKVPDKKIYDHYSEKFIAYKNLYLNIKRITAQLDT